MRKIKMILSLLMVMTMMTFTMTSVSASPQTGNQVHELKGAVDVQPIKTTLVGNNVEYKYNVSLQPVISNDGSQFSGTYVIGVPAKAVNTTVTLVSTNQDGEGVSPVAVREELKIQKVTQENFNDKTTSILPTANNIDSNKYYVATTDDLELLQKMLAYQPVEGVKYYFISTTQKGVVGLEVNTYITEDEAKENGKVAILAESLAKSPQTQETAYIPVEESGSISLRNYRPANEGTVGSASYYVAHGEKIGEEVQNGNYVLGSYDEHGIYNTTMIPTKTGNYYEIGPDNNGLNIKTLQYIKEFHLYLNVSVTYIATNEDMADAAVLNYQTGSVIVHYENTEGRTIASSVVHVNEQAVGMEYSVLDLKHESIEFEGNNHTFVEVKAGSHDEEGTVEKGIKEITYVYDVQTTSVENDDENNEEKQTEQKDTTNNESKPQNTNVSKSVKTKSTVQQTKQAPKTGDQTNIEMVITMMTVSLGLIIVIVGMKKYASQH